MLVVLVLLWGAWPWLASRRRSLASHWSPHVSNAAYAKGCGDTCFSHPPPVSRRRMRAAPSSRLILTSTFGIDRPSGFCPTPSRRKC